MPRCYRGSAPETTLNGRELRRAWLELCIQSEPDIMLTLVTNRRWDIPRMRQLVRDFAARMDDWGLGGTWAREARDRRLDGIFFIEHVGSNIHAHGLVHFPYGNEGDIRLFSGKQWAELCPSGSIDMTLIDRHYGCASYCTKELQAPLYRQEQIVLLTEFMSPTSLSKRPTKQR